MPNPHLPTALLASALLFALAPALSAQPALSSTPAKPRSMQQIIDESKPPDWRRIDPANTLVMELDAGRVVIELAPQIAPQHAENIRTLAREGFWNGLSINRSQDNFVVQWGDPAEDESKRKPLGSAKTKLPAEFERVRAKDAAFDVLPDADGWAPQVGFVEGFPAGRDPANGATWLAHCYGMVGAGRDIAADSSTGAELYVVTGQSPRQLDRNITTVGRVVEGIELLSTMPRGTGPLGFYEKREQRTPIRAIRLASELPERERPALEAMRTDTAAFTELVEARRNRRDDFYKRPAGHIDLCNVPLPVRVADAKTKGAK
ncbi:peptidylprolyl isomerase [Cognatilysobacter bugurensis]|uniref:peptidylprolyl isomerase n=1 Tax=Cognatilysobacter bugurensis TaxID=543356 RepID=A0A918SRT6_9GAMM|nr:peptidyl-prolyl cis-trans isomerase [Lysobacter bugurensis]